MKTNTENTPIAIPDFPGIVIDPATGRKCALQVDIFRGIGLQGDQVTKSNARIYQSRFFDIEDVLKHRLNIKPQGVRRRGIAITEMLTAVVGMCVGMTIATGVAVDAAKSMTPTLREAVGWQEMNVKMMEDLGMSGAEACRAQWEPRKARALAGIVNVENLNPENPQL